MTGTGVTDLTVVRDGTTALRDVTLEAADGELLVVLGASGSGKSTLLRILAGLEHRDPAGCSSGVATSPPCRPGSGGSRWSSRRPR